MARTCKKCGCSIPDDAPGLDCPACQLRSAFSEGDDLEGLTINNYKILSKIGLGGFGVVYLAQQLEPVRRKVAFKVMKRERIGTTAVAQFVAEQQALAVMNHPNIAKIFDAGETEWGAPYFVMELIEGTPITKFCDKKRLAPLERLRIFRDVCGAIQHAHQKAIIHRDIKPSNILVAEIDDKPVPKIIDFGIAKAVGTPLHELVFDHSNYSIIGTPEYMPPEQARGDSDIDTRADVYSLGVLLYELLIGTPPFTRKEIREAGIDAILQLIEEKRPPSPSERLRSLDDQGETIAQARHLEPPELKRLIRGDLDWIVMKAIEKNRAVRYESATALARDIDAYLGNRPLATKRRTAGYRLRKFCRRNRPLVVGGAALILIALLASTVSYSMWKKQRRQQADTLFDKLRECRIEHLPIVVSDVGDHASYLDPILISSIADPRTDAREKLRARFALLPRHPEQVGALTEEILKASPIDLTIYLALLEEHGDELNDLAWRWIPDETAELKKRLQAAAIGASAGSSNARWATAAPEIAAWLLEVGSYEASNWAHLLQPLAPWFEQALLETDHPVEVQSNLALALLLLDRQETVFPLLERAPNPDLRTGIIHGSASAGIDWKVFEAGLRADQDPGVTAACLSALGEFPTARLTRTDRRRLQPTIEGLFVSHPDAEVHSMSEWLLRSWSPSWKPADQLKGTTPNPESKWFRTPGGDYTMVVIEPGEVMMGSPEDEPGRLDNEGKQTVALTRTIAVATTEITKDQFMVFAQELGVEQKLNTPPGWNFPASPTGDCSMTQLSLQEAMLYCRWLTTRDNLGEEEQCYRYDGNKLVRSKPVTTVENYLDKSGYRILTEPEWEYACRAGTITSRHFGQEDTHLDYYAWHAKNADGHAQPPGLLRPNQFGLFDMLGNIAEWCQEPFWKTYQAHPPDKPISITGEHRSFTYEEGQWFVFRGGAFTNQKSLLRCAKRSNIYSYARPTSGFRIARTIKTNK